MILIFCLLKLIFDKDKIILVISLLCLVIVFFNCDDCKFKFLNSFLKLFFDFLFKVEFWILLMVFCNILMLKLLVLIFLIIVVNRYCGLMKNFKMLIILFFKFCIKLVFCFVFVKLILLFWSNLFV